MLFWGWKWFDLACKPQAKSETLKKNVILNVQCIKVGICRNVESSLAF